MAQAQDRPGCPRGWLREPSYPSHVELERAELSARWQPDDWTPDPWDGLEGPTAE